MMKQKFVTTQTVTDSKTYHITRRHSHSTQVNSKSSKSSIKPLVNKGETPKVKLGQCEGDCDKHADCQKGLVCYQRDKHNPVPGCSAGGSGDFTD